MSSAKQLRADLEALLTARAGTAWKLDAFAKDDAHHGHAEWNDGKTHTVVVRGARDAVEMWQALIAGVQAMGVVA